MDFNLDQDLAIFDSFFARRPEVSPESLKHDLEFYYLPYAQKLIDLKHTKKLNEGLLIGVSAIQGAGKTTQGEILEILLNHFGHSTNSLSIDDHYLTHKQLCELRQKDPRFIRRGVTHDINLALRDLKKLKSMENSESILISGYDKGAQLGDGDRFNWVNLIPFLTVTIKVVGEELILNKQNQNVKAIQLVSLSLNDQPLRLLDNMGSDIPLVEHLLPKELLDFLTNHLNQEVIVTLEDDQAIFTGNSQLKIASKNLPNGWRVVTKKPDFIFYDGWMLGARRVEDESVFDSNLPALETAEARQFAKDINQKLTDYLKLWNLIDFINVLYVPNYQISLEWRDQAEEHLRAKGEGMSKKQIVEFVHYFWRSVHPAIQIKNLAHDETNAQQVVIINYDHSLVEILTPEETKIKYP